MANMDSNDDGDVNIADAVKVLGFLFSGDTLLAPDASPITAGQDGCYTYPVSDVTLPCDNPCTP